MPAILDDIKYFVKGCWLPHSFITVNNNGDYIYQECIRCGQRKVIIEHLQSKLPDYEWVRHDKDQL